MNALNRRIFPHKNGETYLGLSVRFFNCLLNEVIFYKAVFNS